MEDEISFGPDPLLVGLWTLLCSPPALVTGYLLVKAPTQAAAIQFAWTLVFPLLPVLFAYRFRATFTPTEFIYRRWGQTIRVPLSDVGRIEVTNSTPISKQAAGAFIVTKQGSRLPFWPKVFPREAVNRFFSLAS